LEIITLKESIKMHNSY